MFEIRAGAGVIADSLLVLVDNESYAESWNLFADMFRSQVDRVQLGSGISAARSQVNPLSDQELISIEYTTDLPRAMPGEYVVFTFRSRSGSGARISESVMVIHEDDGSWAIMGYGVMPEPNP